MERQSYKNYIINKYGDIICKTLKEFQAATKTTEILNKDIEFLSKCKRSKIIPTHCKIGGRRSTSPMTRKMIEETERKLFIPLNCQKLLETVETAKNQGE